jgi:hypothetical protein
MDSGELDAPTEQRKMRTNQMMLEDAWNEINAAVRSQSTVGLENALLSLEELCIPNVSKADVWFASGYACYMLPHSHSLRERAESYFLNALYAQPGHVESVLYLAYLLIDRSEWKAAVKLLFAIAPEVQGGDLTSCDRVVEARVFCLSRLEKWEESLAQLQWFEHRLAEEPDCGLVLINLMKVLDGPRGSGTVEAVVLDKISTIVQFGKK